ncbi:hypothetical protein CWI32_00130 [Acinetobacter pseudolwoffii]|uniref:Uncharacterized protein n=1 Tax=Acinetobacter pseudolwoffii TaxID=2053287 RepID=A0A2H9YTX9_9GAMM|nr:hypothetical protein CWI32_00130 [Acinetobacter pseudolwoffii]
MIHSIIYAPIVQKNSGNWVAGSWINSVSTIWSSSTESKNQFIPKRLAAKIGLIQEQKPILRT